MIKYFVGLVGVVILIAGVVYAVRQSAPEHIEVSKSEDTPAVTTKKYESAKYELAFEYPAEYQLDEHDVAGSALREHYTITLIPKKDLPAPEGGEGSPAITIDIIQNNLDKQTTEGWIRGSSVSNFKLSPEGTLTPVSVDGSSALSYRWSGLYDGTTIAIARTNWVYAFSVTYLEPGADIVQDFVALRESIHFSR